MQDWMHTVAAIDVCTGRKIAWYGVLDGCQPTLIAAVGLMGICGLLSPEFDGVGVCGHYSCFSSILFTSMRVLLTIGDVDHNCQLSFTFFFFWCLF